MTTNDHIAALGAAKKSYDTAITALKDLEPCTTDAWCELVDMEKAIQLAHEHLDEYLRAKEAEKLKDEEKS